MGRRRNARHEIPSSARFLYVYGACPKRWAKRYGIVPLTRPCYGCDAPRTTDLPFFVGQFRGLASFACASCGEASMLYALVRDPRFGALM
jgi:hypothetical protein